MIDPSGVKAIISIEQPCTTTLTPAQIAGLAKIPILVMFGDHLADVQGGQANWNTSFGSCQDFFRKASVRCARRCANVALSRDGPQRQQPHADAGQEQPGIGRPDTRLGR